MGMIGHHTCVRSIPLFARLCVDLRALEHMPWSGAAAFNAARHRPLVLRTGAAQSGTIYTRAAAGANLSFAVIPNAGHLVPHDQPALALAFIEWFVQGT